MRTDNRMVRVTRGLALVIALTLTSAALIFAQELGPPLSPEHREASLHVARRLSGTLARDRTDDYLNAAGFRPETPASGMAALSSYDRIVFAAERAEMKALLGGAQAGEGANRFIALLSHSLARDFGESVARGDALLRGYLERYPTPPQVEFATREEMTRAPSQGPLNVAHQEAIRRLSQYTGRAGRLAVLVHDYRLSFDQATRFLREPNVETMLSEALQATPELERPAVLRRLSLRATRFNASATADPILARWLGPREGDSAPHEPDANPPPEPPTRQRGVGSEEHYDDYIRARYGESPPTFERMLNQYYGPGGVIVGSPVTSARDVRSPVRLAFVADPNRADLVVIKVRMCGNRVARYGPVDADIARVAASIVSGRRSTPASQAVGLVSYSGDNLTMLHPALRQGSLGASVRAVDSNLFDSRRYEDITRHALGDEAAEAVAQALTSAQQGASVLRVADAPLELRIESGRFRLRRAGSTWAPEWVRDSVFFTLWSVARDDRATEAEPFYLVGPTLVEASSDYRALNQFYAVSAILRWVAAAGVQLPPLPSGSLGA